MGDLPIDRRLRSGLDALGVVEFTEIQRAVLPHALAGRDIMAGAETGSGKTLAYLVPAVAAALAGLEQRHSGTLALILVPTRELARQVMRQCRSLIIKLPVTVQAITGGEDFSYQAALLRKDPAILIATPGRLLEHCRRRSADLASLHALVLDEADQMLALGFRDDVLNINRQCPSGKQTLMVSATLEGPGLAGIADALLHQPEIIRVGPLGGPHSRIAHQIVLADGAQHKDTLLTALLRAERFQRALVFANKRVTAVRLAALLRGQQLRCEPLHGEMSTEERRGTLDLFREGRCNIVCASDLAARGLDIQNIDLVVNYDVPRNGDDYLHRTGRTGRAGATGLAISLVGYAERERMSAIQSQLQIDPEKRSLPGLAPKIAGSRATSLPRSTKDTQGAHGHPVAGKRNGRHRKHNSRGQRAAAAAVAKPSLDDGSGPVMKKRR